MKALGNDAEIQFGISESYRGEASISSLCAGIIFVRALDFLPELLDELLLDKRTGGYSLAAEIAKEHPMEVALLGIDQLSDPKRATGAAHVLKFALPLTSPQLRGQAVVALKRALSSYRFSPIISRNVAQVLRLLDPSDLSAWDVLAETIGGEADSGGYALTPVPKERLDATLELINLHGGQFAREVVSGPNGDAEEQLAFAVAMDKLFCSGRMTSGEIGAVAEEKLYSLQRDLRFEPWLSLALKLVHAGGEVARSYLVFAAFGDDSMHPSIVAIRDQFLAADLTADEVGFITGKLVKNGLRLSEWWPMFVKLHGINAEAADGTLYMHMAILWTLGRLDASEYKIADMALEFWGNLRDDQQSSTSKRMLSRAKLSEDISLIFSSK